MRPERLLLSDGTRDGSELRGTVRENIFIGTDLSTIVALDEGPDVIVRTSNSDRGNKRIFEPGAKVFVAMEEGAGRLLVD